MTEQELFNTVYLGLAAQNFERSMSAFEDMPTCAYRGDNGMKCAVGHLISDDQYKKKMEDRSVEHIVMMHDLDHLKPHVCFLEGLQGAHDAGIAPELMQGMFKDIAAERGLTCPDLPSTA